ncbi:MAG: DNA cytosine methyltransferase [Lysobacteraceae bacterium]
MRTVDLFSGAGGFSTGALMAGCTVVWAANHWPEAVAVHSENHPQTMHACQDLHQAQWPDVPAHDLLLASPACQGHSRARGKERPHHDAQRSTAWAVVSATEYHRPQFFIVENVPEFVKWRLFPVWSDAMTSLGYALSINVIDSADHGVPQHRRRVFVVGTRSRRPLDLQFDPAAHDGAASFIRFDSGRWSPVKRPGRSAVTLARIREGRKQHGDRFLTAYYGNERGGRALSRPIGTITTRDRWAIVDGNRMRMLSIDENRAAMGFPEHYKLPRRHKDAMHMLGNAVCPPVACAIISELRRRA